MSGHWLSWCVWGAAFFPVAFAATGWAMASEHADKRPWQNALAVTGSAVVFFLLAFDFGVRHLEGLYSAWRATGGMGVVAILFTVVMGVGIQLHPGGRTVALNMLAALVLHGAARLLWAW